jgi:hypothetical protein
MNNIHKKFFIDVFDGDIELYNEYMRMISKEYDEIIKKLKKSTSIIEIRCMVHKLISIIINLSFYCDIVNDLVYLCRILLRIDKKNVFYNYYYYDPFITNIIVFDKRKIGL